MGVVGVEGAKKKKLEHDKAVIRSGRKKLDEAGKDQQTTRPLKLGRKKFFRRQRGEKMQDEMRPFKRRLLGGCFSES